MPCILQWSGESGAGVAKNLHTHPVGPIRMKGQVHRGGPLCRSAYPNKTGASQNTVYSSLQARRQGSEFALPDWLY